MISYVVRVKFCIFLIIPNFSKKRWKKNISLHNSGKSVVLYEKVKA